MEQIAELLGNILEELQEMNRKLDEIKGSGFVNLDDIGSKLDEIAGTGVEDSLSDVCSKLDDLAGGKSLGDISGQLDSIELFIR